MINNIIERVKEILKELYPTFNIYTMEAAEITEPAFIIKITECKRDKKLGRRGIITIKIQIECKQASTNQLSYYDIANNLDNKFQIMKIGNDSFYSNNQSSTYESNLKYTFSIKIPYFNVIEEVALINNLSKKIKLS
ncbi:hypothetical protein IMX26_10640 [Clostridium sp. 'deep sea']|uniref:phage tail terminator family protein n=1 Tax=Clostridium sp. 'deep sea' TaxID=2779445 RepID=UPI001896757E|nr:hypothetical protein [Clostridium sp. 'deep sea']QOR33949.1 hypothetical protein IMX26_10640 [Clostridium sp. 'deep sea']